MSTSRAPSPGSSRGSTTPPTPVTTAFPSLPVTAAHGVRAGLLPMVHEDPFDRILVAQAQAHGLVLMTRNPWIPSYDVEVMPV